MILFKVSCHFLSSDGGLMFHVYFGRLFAVKT